MIKQDLIVLYIEDIDVSKIFYKKIFDIDFNKKSESFYTGDFGHSEIGFKLISSLKTMSDEVFSKIKGGGTEVSFSVSDINEFENIKLLFKNENIKMFGYCQQVWGVTFFIEDPDKHRFRFNYSLINNMNNL